ncbi:MAG: TraR/DksA family transcriptional regulator, partial [Acidimicrobiia bacterium]
KAPVKKAAPAKKAVAKKAPAKPAPPVKKPPAGKTCPLSGMWVPKQSPNVTPKTMEKLRELLLEERDRHVRQAADLQAEADALVSEREQGDTQFDEESGEGDTISVERERDLMLSASAQQAVEEIDRALQRMDAGTYGLCTPAGRRIPVARLEAIPWAETCVDCKQRVERRR